MAKNIIAANERGAIYLDKNGKAQLIWNPGFSSRFTQQYSKAQKFVDNEVLRGCSALVPFQTGALQKSGILGTDVGSGEVAWIVPYAQKQYYETPRSRSYDAHRGAYWFERWKASDGGRTIRQAKKLAGGG